MTAPVRRAGLLANVGWMVVAEAVGKVASFAFVLVVARGLGLSAYGTFNFALSFVPLFLLLASSGLNVAVLREVATDESRVSPIVASALRPRLGLLAVAYAASLAVAPLLVDGRESLLAVALVGAALVCDELTGFLGAVFKAFERMSAHASTLVVNRVVSTGLAVAVVQAGGGLVAVTAVYLVGSAGSLAAGVVLLRRRFPPIRLADADGTLGRRLVRDGFVLGLASALNLAVFRIDAVLLQAMEGTAAVGLYGVAYRFLDSTLFLAWSLASAVMPRIARRGATEQSSRTLAAVTSAAAAFYVPFAIGSLFLADWAVRLLFSARFEAAGDAVPWLAGAGLFYAVAYLCRLALIAIGRRGALVAVAATTLAFNVVANLVVIPRYGFEGAAAVTLLTEVLEAAILLFLFARATGRVPLDVTAAVPLAGGVGMAAALALTGADGWTGVVVALLSGAVGAAVGALVVGVGRVRSAVAEVR